MTLKTIKMQWTDAAYSEIQPDATSDNLHRML